MCVQYLKEVIIEFEKLLQEFGGQVIPCTNKEVEQLESLTSSPYHLPAAYKEFLLYGGKKMARVFKDIDFSYHSAKLMLESGYRDFLNVLQFEDPDAQLPPDIFVLDDHLGSNFTYFKLTEGDNPPVYWWEEGEGGLEVAQKQHDSFSDFLLNEIRIQRIYLMPDLTRKKLEARQPPRGRQIWYPTPQERREGITLPALMFNFGFRGYQQIDSAADLCGLDPNQYLEELSGWQCHPDVQERNQTRFFSPNVWAKSSNEIP